MKSKAGLLYFWDFLVWVLIAFPLLTGGVWIKRPGLFIELAELGGPVLVVSLLGALLHYWKKIELSEASSIRLALNLWRRWNELIEQKPRATLWLTALCSTVLLSLSSLRRHWAYGSGAYDLGIFTNAIWNLTHGIGYVSSVKFSSTVSERALNLFADHQSPVFWLFAPLFKLFPYPETLLILQAAAISTGGVALYWLGRQYLKNEYKAWASALPLLYWAYLPTRNANAFDFHPEVTMLPLFLWAILGLQSETIKARLLGLTALIVGLGAKESAGPVAFGVGLAWLACAAPEQTRSFCRKMGVALMAIGVAVFYVDTHLVPQMFGGSYVYSSNYSQFGDGVSGIILSFFTKPVFFLSYFFGKARLKFLLWTLGPLSFLPLIGWQAFLAALPGYAMLFLSEGDQRLNLQFHYATEASIGLFWATALALTKVSRRPSPRPRQLAWAMLICALVFFGRSELFRIRKFSPTAHTQWLQRKVLPCVNPTASLATTGALVPHLATRPWIHDLPQIRTPGGGPEGAKVQCVIYDSQLDNWPMTDDVKAKLSSTLQSQNFASVYRCDGIEVFQNRGPAQMGSESCLTCVPVCEMGQQK